MPKRNEVEILISLEDRMTREMKRAGGSLEQFRSQAAKVALGLGVVGAAAGGVIFTIKQLTDRAREQAKAEESLAVVLNNSGASWTSLRGEILETTAAIQQKTTIGDERQLAALTRLIPIIGDYERAMQALPTIIDAAAVSGSSLEAVAGTLGRALAGQANTAESLGITFDASAGFAERLATAQGLVGGAAEANAENVGRLSDEIGNLTEAIGEKLLPAMEDGSGVMARFLAQLTSIVKGRADLTDEQVAFFEKVAAAETRAERNVLRSRETLRKINESAAGSYNELGIFKAETIALSKEEAEVVQDLQEKWDRATGGIREISKESMAYAALLKQAEEDLAAYNATIDNNLAQLIKQTDATLAQEEAQALLNKRYEADQRALALMVLKIEDVNGELQDQTLLAQNVETVIHNLERGYITVAQAQTLFSSVLEEGIEILDKETEALRKKERAMKRIVALQDQMTGGALARNVGLPPSLAQLESAFGGLTHNALRAGFTLGDNGQLVSPGGYMLNFDIFQDLVNELSRGGFNAADALIEAIRRIRRLFGFEHGGVVPGPLGAPQLAVVHGGEEVLTPGQRGGLTVNVYVAGSVVSNQQLKDFINRSILDTQRAGGGRR